MVVAHRALAWLARRDDNAGKVSEHMASPVATRSDPVKIPPCPVSAPCEWGETGLVFPLELLGFSISTPLPRGICGI